MWKLKLRKTDEWTVWRNLMIILFQKGTVFQGLVSMHTSTYLSLKESKFILINSLGKNRWTKHMHCKMIKKINRLPYPSPKFLTTNWKIQSGYGVKIPKLQIACTTYQITHILVHPCIISPSFNKFWQKLHATHLPIW